MSKLISIRIPDNLYEQISARAKASNRTISNQIVTTLQDESALRLLIEWAVDSDWGYDDFPEECEEYSNIVAEKGLAIDYTEGMIWVAKQMLESGKIKWSSSGNWYFA